MKRGMYGKSRTARSTSLALSGNLVTCEEAEAQCGMMSDGCGGTLDCGQCLEDEECGLEEPNQCTNTRCEASDCASLNAECGSIDNGCGRMIDCGVCTGDAPCGMVAPNRCGGVDLTEFTHLHTRKMRGATTDFCNVFPGDTFLCWGYSRGTVADRPDISGPIVDLKDDCILNAAGEGECRVVDGFQVTKHRVPGGPYKQIVGRVDLSPRTYYFLTEGGAWAGYDYDSRTGFNDGTIRPIPEGDGLFMATLFAGVACGLTAAGTIDCRSYLPDEPDPFGLVSTVPTEGPFVQIRASRTTHCALSVSGQIHCWGQVPDPSNLPAEVSRFFAEQFSAIDLYDDEICGLTRAGGRFRCIRNDDGERYVLGRQGQFGPGYTEIFVQFLLNNYGVCARTAEGALNCNPAIGEKIIQGQFKDFSMSDELICGISGTGQIQCNDDRADQLEDILQPLNRLGPYEKVSVWRPEGLRNPRTNICAATRRVRSLVAPLAGVTPVIWSMRTGASATNASPSS